MPFILRGGGGTLLPYCLILFQYKPGSQTSDNGGSSGAIIGGAAGGVVVIVVISIMVLLVLIYMRQLRQKKSNSVVAGIANTISDSECTLLYTHVGVNEID